MADRNTSAGSMETSPPQALSLPGPVDARPYASLAVSRKTQATGPVTHCPQPNLPSHRAVKSRAATILPPTIAKLAATDEAAEAGPALRISPEDVARRQSASWGPLAGEIVQVTQAALFEAHFCAPAHLLIAAERGERHEGETFLEGLPRSTLHNMSQKLTFVPAGRKFQEWQDPRILPRLTCLYLDPDWYPTEASRGELEPRLFFHDADLWATVRKLTCQIERSGGADRLYVDALGLVLMRELLRLTQGPTSGEPARPGSLADWQAKRTAEYIEAHLGERISLASLAGIARLSPYHFARAFKRSFGMPPHRYHTARRIERAKTLLARPSLSITEIALEIGFGETSSFTTAFRRLVGRTPSSYRRSVF